MEKNQKTILLLINGLGISLAQNGNAVVAAKPTVFSHMWHENFHVPILPARNHEELTPENQYLSFVTGKNIISPTDLAAAALRDNLLEENIAVQSVFDYSKRHNSAVHFVGTLNKSRFDQIMATLQIMAKIAGKRALYDVHFHFLIDESFADAEELGTYLSKIERLIGSTRIGEISTIAGKNFVNDFSATDSMIDKLFKAILKANGKKFLSVRQGLANWKNIEPVNIEPASIVSDMRRVSRVNSFDSIFFFDFEQRNVAKFLSLFSTKHSISSVDKNLRHLEIGSMVAPVASGDIEFRVAYPFAHQKNLFEYLIRHDRKISLYSEDYRYQTIHNLLSGVSRFSHEFFVETPRRTATYNQNWEKITQAIFDKAIKDLDNDSDFVLIDIPLIERLCDQGDFKIVVESIKFLDDCIGRLKTAIVDHGDSLVLTSLYGMSEAMRWKNYPATKISFCELSHNPLPFILFNNKKFEQGKRHIIHEIAKANYTVADIGKNLLEIAGVDSSTFDGKKFQ